MKINQIIKGALGVFALAGAAFLTGCASAPVAEIVEEQTFAVPVSQTQTIRTLAPVAESCDIPVETVNTFCN